MIRPVGVGLMSRSPTGVVGFTVTTSIPLRPAARATCFGLNFDRLYGPIISSTATGESSSAPCPLDRKPMVATLEVYTTRRTPFLRAASRTARVPSTFDRYICSGSRTHSR